MSAAAAAAAAALSAKSAVVAVFILFFTCQSISSPFSPFSILPFALVFIFPSPFFRKKSSFRGIRFLINANLVFTF